VANGKDAGLRYLPGRRRAEDSESGDPYDRANGAEDVSGAISVEVALVAPEVPTSKRTF